MLILNQTALNFLVPWDFRWENLTNYFINQKSKKDYFQQRKFCLFWNYFDFYYLWIQEYFKNWILCCYFYRFYFYLIWLIYSQHNSCVSKNELILLIYTNYLKQHCPQSHNFVINNSSQFYFQNEYTCFQRNFENFFNYLYKTSFCFWCHDPRSYDSNWFGF